MGTKATKPIIKLEVQRTKEKIIINYLFPNAKEPKVLEKLD